MDELVKCLLVMKQRRWPEDPHGSTVRRCILSLSKIQCQNVQERLHRRVQRKPSQIEGSRIKSGCFLILRLVQFMWQHRSKCVHFLPSSMVNIGLAPLSSPCGTFHVVEHSWNSTLKSVVNDHKWGSSQRWSNGHLAIENIVDTVFPIAFTLLLPFVFLEWTRLGADVVAAQDICSMKNWMGAANLELEVANIITIVGTEQMMKSEADNGSDISQWGWIYKYRRD